MPPIASIFAALRQKQPLIHCITNPISINHYANAVLAVGARPIMAEHPREVREITETADALLLNLGNITDARMASMAISAEAARDKGVPFVLDAVGVACSSLRRELVRELLAIATPAVIKGNASEILALYSDAYRSSGVDADGTLTTEAIVNAAAALARKHRTVILVSGKTDLITDGQRLLMVHNGTPALSTVTGTGCMLGTLCATFLAVAAPMDAAVIACATLGVCGEIADTGKGSGTFMVGLMDALCTVTAAELEKHMKLEETSLE